MTNEQKELLDSIEKTEKEYYDVKYKSDELWETLKKETEIYVSKYFPFQKEQEVYARVKIVKKGDDWMKVKIQHIFIQDGKVLVWFYPYLTRPNLEIDFLAVSTIYYDEENPNIKLI